MRFILGLVVGVVLVVGGAYIHDSVEPSSTKPLVIWENAAELEHASYDYIRTQFDRLVSWVTSSSK